MTMHTLPAGTVLYHGTSDPDFDEVEDSFRGPAWVTDSPEVARRFAKRNEFSDPRPRVLEFVLEEDLELRLIRGRADMVELEETHGISFAGVEDMRDTVEASGIPGWFIPNNYPEGADILIVDTTPLRHVKTEALDEAQAAPSRMRP